MPETIAVTFTRAEYEALVEALHDAGVMHQFPQDALATLHVLDLRSALLTLEAAALRPLARA